jgi:hypothetical protein
MSSVKPIPVLTLRTLTDCCFRMTSLLGRRSNCRVRTSLQQTLNVVPEPIMMLKNIYAAEDAEEETMCAWNPPPRSAFTELSIFSTIGADLLRLLLRTMSPQFGVTVIHSFCRAFARVSRCHSWQPTTHHALQQPYAGVIYTPAFKLRHLSQMLQLVRKVHAESALNELCFASIFFSVSAAPSKYNAAETGRLQLSAI